MLLVSLLFVAVINPYSFLNSKFLFYNNIINDVIVVSLSDYEGVSEVWQLVPSDIFSLITIQFQGKIVKVGVSSDHVIEYC